MLLTVPHLPLIGLTPVPEERGRAFQPLEPRSVGASPDGIMPSTHRCLSVWVRADESPLCFVGGPPLRCSVEVDHPNPISCGEEVADHLSRAATLGDSDVAPSPGKETPQDLPPPPA